MPSDTDLAVDVAAGVQQHLDHGLVAAHAGVHQGGHPLEGQGERVEGGREGGRERGRKAEGGEAGREREREMEGE